MAGHRDYFACPHCQKYHARGHEQKEQKCLPPAPNGMRTAMGSIFDPCASFEYPIPVTRYTLPNGQMLYASDDEHDHTKELLELAFLEGANHTRKLLLSEKPPDSQTELIVSYRVWRYDNGNLRSAYKDTLWPQFKPMTKDIYQDMGIHGVKDYKKIPELMDAYGGGSGRRVGPVDMDPENIMVAGAINMWGSVREHEIGYLSEFAYPKELYVGPDVDILKIMTLEENYGVPVTVREELARTAWKSREDSYPWSNSVYYNAAAVQAVQALKVGISRFGWKTTKP